MEVVGDCWDGGCGKGGCEEEGWLREAIANNLKQTSSVSRSVPHHTHYLT